MNSAALPLPMSPAPSPSRGRIFRQLLIVAAVFAAVVAVAAASGLRFAGPGAVVAAAVAAFFVTRGERPGASALGLSRMPPLRIAGWSVAGVLLVYVGAGVATVLATKVFGWAPMRTEALGMLRGNLPALAGLLAIAWTSAAIGEEVLFRGFLQGRLQALFGGRRGAGVAAVLLQAVVFGLAHAYQGPTGILVTGTVGLVLGLLYLRLRTVWPLVLAHGIVDTVGLLALYAGVAPAA